MPPKEGILSKIASFLRGPPPKTPITGFGVRIKNILKYHWRGLLGHIVPLCLFIAMLPRHDNPLKVKLMWFWMAWYFLIRPVNIPVTGLIPIFFAPMLGVLQTSEICQCYMNENIILFLLTSMLILLLNNSGVDRRVIVRLLSSGNTSQFSAEKMVYKCSTAAFFLSIFSSRLITASIVTEYFTKAMTAVEAKYGGGRDEANLKEVRYVVNNAIQTSSAIGSMAIVHSAFATLCFRAIFCESGPENSQYPDIFNYLQYSAFAVPVATVMFVLNLVYHMVLVKKVAKKPMSKYSMAHLQKLLTNNRGQIPAKISLHEQMTIAFTIVFLAFHISRWSEWLGGWGSLKMENISKPETPLPAIRDATCSAVLVVLLHVLPSGFNFLKYFTVSKRSELPPPKMESSILWWKFVDKNLNYGYFFLIGSGVAIMTMARKSNLCDTISTGCGSNITSLGWNIGALIIIVIGGILSNLVSGTAACVIFLPFVLCAASKAEQPWPQQAYLAALATGISSSFGFSYPFLYTPAYYCHYVGKVPAKKMVVNSVISILICIIILWVAIVFYAPIIWDIDGKGILVIQGEVTGAEAGASEAAPEAAEEPA